MAVVNKVENGGGGVFSFLFLVVLYPGQLGCCGFSFLCIGCKSKWIWLIIFEAFLSSFPLSMNSFLCLISMLRHQCYHQYNAYFCFTVRFVFFLEMWCLCVNVSVSVWDCYQGTLEIIFLNELKNCSVFIESSVYGACSVWNLSVSCSTWADLSVSAACSVCNDLLISVVIINC